MDGTATSTMTELQAWSFLVGFLMPLLTAVVQQPGWSAKLRAWVGVAASGVAGLVTVALQHGIHLDGHLMASMATVVVASQSTYMAFWKKTGITSAVETATSTTTDHH